MVRGSPLHAHKICLAPHKQPQRIYTSNGAAGRMHLRQRVCNDSCTTRPCIEAAGAPSIP